jgi:hypothetical protein
VVVSMVIANVGVLGVFVQIAEKIEKNWRIRQIIISL